MKSPLLTFTENIQITIFGVKSSACTDSVHQALSRCGTGYGESGTCHVKACCKGYVVLRTIAPTTYKGLVAQANPLSNILDMSLYSTNGTARTHASVGKKWFM